MSNLVSDLLVFPQPLARSRQKSTGLWRKTTATAQTQREASSCHQEGDLGSLVVLLQRQISLLRLKKANRQVLGKSSLHLCVNSCLPPEACCRVRVKRER